MPLETRHTYPNSGSHPLGPSCLPISSNSIKKSQRYSNCKGREGRRRRPGTITKPHLSSHSTLILIHTSTPPIPKEFRTCHLICLARTSSSHNSRTLVTNETMTTGRTFRILDNDEWRKIASLKDVIVGLSQTCPRASGHVADSRVGDKQRRETEERARITENQAAAGAAYRVADPSELASNDNPSGLPWGSISIRHAMEAGQARTQGSHTSPQGSTSNSQGTTQG